MCIIYTKYRISVTYYFLIIYESSKISFKKKQIIRNCVYLFINKIHFYSIVSINY